ncbi:MAG: FAD synthase [Parcubacteria group bacterium QH_9_35_7]|nr:MAG: FAD synthase [Parcubacteria group bacterium QH_9_35_7]
MKKVMIFGTFDIFHIGHLKFIKQAKELGDKLIVVISRDNNVRKIKDKKPVHNEQHRKEILNSIKYIDKAILGNKDDVYKVIKKNKPDIIALGYDQSHFVDKLDSKLKEFNLNTKVVRLEPYQEDKFKSSKIRNK